MSGPDNQRLVIQPRDLQLLSEIAVMRVVDREQAKAVAGFGSTTRINARLLRLTRYGALKQFFFGSRLGSRKALYVLSAAGAALAHVPFNRMRRHQGQELTTDLFLEHQLEINRIYIALKHRPIPAPAVSFGRWLVSMNILALSAPTIPDGCFELASPTGPKLCFLEVDMGTERPPVWKKKVAAYLAFATSGMAAQRFGHSQFRVLVVTTNDRRLQSIRSVIARFTEKVFFLTTFENIKREGLWSSIWLRPVGDERQAFV